MAFPISRWRSQTGRLCSWETGKVLSWVPTGLEPRVGPTGWITARRFGLRARWKVHRGPCWSESTGRLRSRNASLAQSGFEVLPESRVVLEESVD